MTKVECPHPDCDTKKDTRQGIAVHFGQIHSGETPPWRLHRCDYCAEMFDRKAGSLTGGNKFCGFECYGKFKSETTDGKELPWYKGGKKTFECTNCGNEFRALPSQRVMENTFCSHACFADWESVPNNDRPYYGPRWEEQRREALERAGNLCSWPECEKTECDNGRALHVHHIVPFLEFDDPEEANKQSNLIPVCARHHPKIEKMSHEQIQQTRRNER
ncbi:HNH endonuclease [Haloarcula virus HCTV-15]|nr:HNH endonuclease [Haloarcula virus HCTV-6]UBF22526.1 HNH endonuclease [Haloarcula virus HCTV-15]